MLCELSTKIVSGRRNFATRLSTKGGTEQEENKQAINAGTEKNQK